MHLGGAWSALASWIVAKRAGGAWVVRIEDLDQARTVPGAEQAILDDLRWLGFAWDEPPVRQSDRLPLYRRAVDILDGHGLVYPCDCSRAEIARVASAPHAGEEVVYPGTCRDRDPKRAMKRPPALRVRVPDESIAYDDAVLGRVAQNLAHEVGDFVLRRGDGVFAYQLAVVVDDLATAITDVVRGADLTSSTPRQIWLARALGGEPPRYGHVPLVVASDGQRLEKRTGGVTIAELRRSGARAEAIVGALGHALGVAPTDAARTPSELASGPTTIGWRRSPWPAPSRFA